MTVDDRRCPRARPLPAEGRSVPFTALDRSDHLQCLHCLRLNSRTSLRISTAWRQSGTMLDASAKRARVGEWRSYAG